MAGFVFNIGAEQIVLGTTVWGTSTIRARLVTTAAGAPDVDADAMTGIGSAQATATVAITDDQAPTKSDARDRMEFTTTGNVVFPAAALAIGACDRMVFYRFSTDDAGSVPIACVEMTEVTPNGGDVTVTQPSNGWFFLDTQP
jgi:hypothetical protein